MAKMHGIYKCEICGNVVEVVHEGKGELVCCGQPMKYLEENTVEASKEKHIPVIKKESDKIIVEVGSVPHPMEEKHYIEFIELIADGIRHIAMLTPGMEPKAVFSCSGSKLEARIYCNLHGVWKS
ncbi:MAG TPA: desulfoferrodoxin [Exilispira sp.]|nr:desulfoferrodoxin [Exilispira sp.]